MGLARRHGRLCHCLRRAARVPRITQKVQSTILGVLAGLLTYFVLAIDDADQHA